MLELSLRVRKGILLTHKALVQLIIAIKLHIILLVKRDLALLEIVVLLLVFILLVVVRILLLFFFTCEHRLVLLKEWWMLSNFRCVALHGRHNYSLGV